MARGCWRRRLAEEVREAQQEYERLCCNLGTKYFNQGGEGVIKSISFENKSYRKRGRIKIGYRGVWGVENSKVEIFLHPCYGVVFIYFQQYRWVREVRRE